MSASARVSGSARSTARGVGCRPVGPRTNSSSRSSDRRRDRAALIAGWVRPMRVPARVDAALRHEGVEGDEQVQVDPVKIHAVDGRTYRQVISMTHEARLYRFVSDRAGRAERDMR